MHKDVVCGMQVDQGRRSQSVQRKDLLFLLEGLQSQVRFESRPVREVVAWINCAQAVEPGYTRIRTWVIGSDLADAQSTDSGRRRRSLRIPWPS